MNIPWHHLPKNRSWTSNLDACLWNTIAKAEPCFQPKGSSFVERCLIHSIFPNHDSCSLAIHHWPRSTSILFACNEMQVRPPQNLQPLALPLAGSVMNPHASMVRHSVPWGWVVGGDFRGGYPGEYPVTNNKLCIIECLCCHFVSSSWAPLSLLLVSCVLWHKLLIYVCYWSV